MCRLSSGYPCWVVTEIEVNGGIIKKADISGRLTFLISDVVIDFTIVEKMRMDSRPTTEKLQKWTAYPGHHNKGHYPTGYLRFKVEGFSSCYGTAEWKETKNELAPNLLPKIVAQLMVHTKSTAASRKRQIARELEWGLKREKSREMQAAKDKLVD